MRKISMLLSMLVVIVALFATTEVKAVVTDPCALISCDDISALPLSPPGSDGRVKWAYQFNIYKLTPTTQFYILAPVCSPATGYSVDTGGLVLAPGVGDSATGFGVGDMSDVTIKLAYQSPNFSFYTDKVYPVRSTTADGQKLMEYKCGRNVIKCPIQGPACLGVSAVESTTECTTMGTSKVKITRDLSTGCATEVALCGATDCTSGCSVILPGDHYVNGVKIIGCTTPDGNQTCRECVIVGTGSSYCYIVLGSGKTAKVPCQ